MAGRNTNQRLFKKKSGAPKTSWSGVSFFCFAGGGFLNSTRCFFVFFQELRKNPILPTRRPDFAVKTQAIRKDVAKPRSNEAAGGGGKGCGSF